MEKSRLIFEDEASFRQDSTLHRTWSRKGCQPFVPVTGQRKSVKVFGCVDILSAKFIYNMDEVFNVASYLNFMEYMATEMFEKNKRVFYIQIMLHIIRTLKYGNGSKKIQRKETLNSAQKKLL